MGNRVEEYSPMCPKCYSPAVVEEVMVRDSKKALKFKCVLCSHKWEVFLTNKEGE